MSDKGIPVYNSISIGGRRRRRSASFSGATSGIPPWLSRSSNPHPSSGWGTVLGGQFDWGGCLLKSNGGVQRFPQRV